MTRFPLVRYRDGVEVERVCDHVVERRAGEGHVDVGEAEEFGGREVAELDEAVAWKFVLVRSMAKSCEVKGAARVAERVMSVCDMPAVAAVARVATSERFNTILGGWGLEVVGCAFVEYLEAEKKGSGDLIFIREIACVLARASGCEHR